jgi:hypothetical protein
MESTYRSICCKNGWCSVTVCVVKEAGFTSQEKPEGGLSHSLWDLTRLPSQSGKNDRYSDASSSVFNWLLLWNLVPVIRVFALIT